MTLLISIAAERRSGLTQSRGAAKNALAIGLRHDDPFMRFSITWLFLAAISLIARGLVALDLARHD